MPEARKITIEKVLGRLKSGPMVLTGCLAIGQTLGLIRTTVVARLLGTEVQGEAVIIGLITGFFASVFTLNATWQLVQSPHHKDLCFMNSLHASMILRGLATTLLIGIASVFILSAIGHRGLILPMLLASLVPLLEGLIHLDAWGLIREGRYRSVALVELAGPCLSFLAAIVAIAVTRTVWVIPIVALSNSLGRLITSHVIASKAWRPRLRREDIREIFRFSAPLIPAGLLFWVNLQGDKIVILLSERIRGMERFDLEELGSYGTIAMLVLAPRVTILKTLDSIVIPRIARGRDSASDLRSRFHECWIATLALSISIAAGGLTLAKPALSFALGIDYAEGIAVSPILLGAMGVQLLRGFGYSASTGMGTTTTVLVGNTARLIGVLLATLASLAHLGLAGLAYSVLAAEVISTVITGIWLDKFVAGAAWRLGLGAMLVGGLSAGINLSLG